MVKGTVPVQSFFRRLYAQLDRASAAHEDRAYLRPPLVRAVTNSLAMDCLVVLKSGADMRLGAAVGALHAGGNLMDIVNRIFGGHGGGGSGVVDMVEVVEVRLELVMGDVWEDQTTSIWEVGQG